MNKYNIEVGDLLGKDRVTEVSSLGLKINNREYLFEWENVDSYVTRGGDWKLTKMNKGKIIGYILLKDTPDTKAGSRVEWTGEWYQGEDSEGLCTSYSKTKVENNPEWFAPIYEEVKPTEVYVDTLAGKVKVTKQYIQLENEIAVDFTRVAQVIPKVKQSIDSIIGFSVKIETFKVGCKTFHISDIPKIEEAIKQVS